MDACPPEVIMLIFEYACSDDLGHAARRLGLVSKYFRTIAEHVEFRTISIAGFEQLRGAVARLESARKSRATGKEGVGIQHLFISELAKKHAVAADADFEYAYAGLRSRFLGTAEGNAAKTFYLEHNDAFWRLVVELIRDNSSSLKTLFLLASNSWVSWRREARYDTRVHTKVLGALSGVAFPRLTYLTVDHDAYTELQCFRGDSSLFESPATPHLQKLRIISWEFAHVDLLPRQHIHPLLKCLPQRCRELVQLTVCSPLLGSTIDVMKHVFIDDWRKVLQNRTLPGKLRSVTLQQAYMPNLSSRTGYIEYFRSIQILQQMVKDLHIEGLETELPAMMRFRSVKKKFELLFDDWKEQCLADSART